MTEYYIIDGGASPYRVIVNDKTVTIKDVKNRKIEINNVYKVFIGKDLTDIFFDGNSILVKIGRFKYIYIGSEIYVFHSMSEIIDYYSPIEKPCNPCPYAIDENFNHYLMSQKTLCNFGEIIVDKPYKVYNSQDYDKNRCIIQQFSTKVLNIL